MTEISANLNLLLKTDGTVTDLLMLIINEKVELEKITEKISDDQSILYREIYLLGIQSKKRWVYAQSQIHLKHLPADFCKDLTQRNIPIGSLWNNYKLETFKEVSDVFQENNHKLFDENNKVQCRTYKVYNNQKLIMEITEKFPISYYQ